MYKLKINVQLYAIAYQHNLLMSGGSDFHDAKRKSEIGDGGIDNKELKKLLNHIQAT
jgi:hypothetical protein